MTVPTPILVGPLKDDAGNTYYEIAVPVTTLAPPAGSPIVLARAVSGPDGTLILPAQDATLESVLAAIQALTSQDAGLATDAHMTTLITDVVNGLATLASGMGADVSEATMPAGGAGQRGWLSALFYSFGTPTDTAYNGTGGSTFLAAARGIYAALTGNLKVVLQAGSAAIGSVTIGAGAAVIGAVTQSGNWALSAGSALIGKVGIDQTTQGTTNGVVVNSGNLTIGSASTVGDGLVTGGATAAGISAAGGGSPSASYAPGNTITLAGGTFTSATVLTVASTQVVGAAVGTGGTGGTTGTQTVTGTTGTGTKFQASVTVAGGAITAVGSISVAGAYTVNPTSLNGEPVTGGGLTGATLNLTMGVLTATVTSAGVYSAAPTGSVAQGSTSGSGTGATFSITYAPIAQTLFGGTAPVNGWKVNSPGVSGDIWVTDNGVAPTANGPSSIRVFSGGGAQYSTEAGEKPAGSAIQLLGPTIGQPFIARRW